MSGAGRKGDVSRCSADAHGGSCCPHAVMGPATEGSGDVLVNGRGAIRVGDRGTHSGCCGPNTWKAIQGAGTVLVNGKPLTRGGDGTEHCGGRGSLIAGSGDVIVGEHADAGQTGLGRNRLRVGLVDARGRWIPGIAFEVRGPTTRSGVTEEGPVVFRDLPPGHYEIHYDLDQRVLPHGTPREGGAR